MYTFEKLIKTKTCSKYLKKYGETCLDQNKATLLFLLENYPQVYKARTDLGPLFRLCLHSIQPACHETVSDKIRLIRELKAKSGVNTLDYQIAMFDNVEFANKLYAERVCAWKIANKNKGGYNAPQYSGMPREEIREIFSETGKKTRATHLRNQAEDPLYFKKMSPLSPHYDGDVWTDEEIQDLHGRTLALGRLPENQEKAMESRKRSGHKLNPSKPSKIAKRFLQPIADFLTETGYDYAWGYDGQKEWWVRDRDDPTMFYFIDFVCNHFNLAVEFHGIAYHPKEEFDESYAPPPFVKHQLSSEKWACDQRKADSIRLKGFHLFVVFEDENFQEKQQEIIEWIKSKIQ